MVGADGGAAHFFDEQSAEGESLIADDVAGKALTGAAGEEAVVGIDFEEAGGEVRLLPVGGAGDDELLEVLDIPTGADELGGEPVEEFGMGGFPPWTPKTSGVLTKPIPKYFCQYRLTVTRAVRGLSGETIQRARPRRFWGASSGRGGRMSGTLRVTFFP